ncbi:hypothetical protein [Fodinicurvata fenggangensis]|uniref:hypothetical protein n=1 Tax=Fodinicurvata fenggangensis TaxID=1121830 RepID=UPI0012DDF4EC|nr:hypothetical protein [Fodinicurvata fenggangensis]
MNGYQIVGSLATFPKRFETLDKVLNSLHHQFDIIYLYINESPKVPNMISKYNNVIPILGKENYGDISANGKIFPLDNIIKKSYIFLLDDDFIYPSDYTNNIVHLINKFHGKIGVTVHGSITSPNPYWYYDRTTGYGWKKGLETHKLVSLIGSGTFAYRNDKFKLSFLDFPKEPMVDLKISQQAYEQKIPLVSIKRPPYWINFLGHEGLWEEYKNQITHHSYYLRRNRLWNYRESIECILKIIKEINGALDRELIEHYELEESIINHYHNNNTHKDWKISENTLEKRVELLNIINNDIKYITHL